MPITLEQSKVGLADHVDQQVIDEFRRDSFILDRLTFDNVVSPGTGGSTLTYGYLQLKTPSVAEGRKLNSEYTAGEAVKTQKTTNLKIFGGAYEVDRVLEDTAASSEIAFQLAQKIIAVKKNMQLIQESLQEFVENQIAIKHFELRNGIFIIQFLPLSDAEIEDLNFDRTKLIQSNREL